MAATGEVAVFTDTNLETHLAIAVNPDITAGNFKRKLRRAHLDCFPELKEIEVHGLMVNRRSHFYSLPDSILLSHAFQGLNGSWFLRAEASIAQAPPQEPPRANCPSPDRKKTKSVKLKRQKHQNNRNEEILMVRTPPKRLSCPKQAERTKKLPRTVVGKRLLTASDNIKASGFKRSPLLSLSRLKAGKFLRQDASSFAKYLVFELSNDSN